jgi:hypothetical protein
MAEVPISIGNIPGFLIAAIATFVVCLIAEPIIQWLMRFFGVYAIVEEGMLNEAGVKLQTFYDGAKARPSSVVRFSRARARRGAKA